MTSWALRLASVLTVGALLALAIPASANHVQSENGRIVVFDHKPGGNEWWVEVIMSGQDAGAIATMEAMDYAGPWVAMQKTSYGSWSASFHIDPGNPVKFRASWAGGAQVTSCWFSHPQGVESCNNTPAPPANWQTSYVGQAGASSYGGDMGMTDVDLDGRRDILVARSHGLYNFEWSGTAWISESVSPRLFDAMAAGDGDGDGTNEVYGVAVTVPDMELMQYRKVNGVWLETRILGLPHAVAGDMTLGNIDGVAGPEMYVGMYDGDCDPNTGLCTWTSTVYLVRKAGSTWSATAIATLNGHIDSMWIGDGDNDGRFELYVGHGTRHSDQTTQVRLVSGTWQATGIGGTGSDSGFSLVVVGDGDRDGKNEVYQVNYYGILVKHTYTSGSGWTMTNVLGFSGMTAPEGGDVNPTAMSLGDGDSDGSQELYVATDRGEVYQVRWTGSYWDQPRIAHPTDSLRGSGGNGILVVGDGDNDGRREVYTTVAFVMANTAEDGVSHVFKVAVVAPAGFDATFTSVRGNEYWIQANVAATGGTLATVDVRLNGGEWRPLTKQSWGGWAASYRAVQGTIVQFRATSTTGATDLSDCYRWIPPSNTDATKVTCGTTPPPPPPPPGFDATFSNVKGNNWWVEAKVTANQPIAKVEARVNCGSTWQTLTLQSWGSYAKSFNVPTGAKVDFRATSTTGATDMSGGYIWPNATPTTGC